MVEKKTYDNHIEDVEEKIRDTEMGNMATSREDESSSKHSSVDQKSASKTDSDYDPDALRTIQVMVAVLLLCLFALSFATSFFLLTTATRSLQADFSPNSYTCQVDSILTDDEDIQCTDPKLYSPCVKVMLNCAGFNDTKLLYKFYRDYFNNKQCSATRCAEPDKTYEDAGKEYKYPHSFITGCCTLNGTLEEDLDESEIPPRRQFPVETNETDLYKDFLFVPVTTFQYDCNKPEAMFYMRDDPGTNSMVLSHPVSYFIIIAPQLIMLVIALVLIGLFITNKMVAKELYRPVTTITPLHLKVNGKWYIKEVKPEEQQMNAFEKLRAANLEK